MAETSRAYTPDTVHPAVPAVAVAADTFTYDALGRMVERVTHEVVPDPVVPDAVVAVEHTLTLSWDASSNLVKTDLDGAVAVYVYDSSGQRVAEIGLDADLLIAPGGTAIAYRAATEATDPNTAASASGDLVGARPARWRVSDAWRKVTDMTETITARTLARETSRVLDSLAQHPRGLIVSRGGAEVAKLVPLSPVEVAWRAAMIAAGHDPDAPLPGDPALGPLEIPAGEPSLADTLAAQRDAERY